MKMLLQPLGCVLGCQTQPPLLRLEPKRRFASATPPQVPLITAQVPSIKDRKACVKGYLGGVLGDLRI